MQLIKETFQGPNFDYYIKEYNSNEQLIFEDAGYGGSCTIRQIFYNDNKTINKILEHRKDNHDGNLQQKFEKIYEYSGENYRVVTYKKQWRNYFDNDPDYYVFGLGNEKWHDVDEIVAIHEFKIEKGLVISERLHNLETNTKTSLLIAYKNEIKISEIRIESNGLTNETRYVYENKKIKAEEYFVDNVLNKRIFFIYENDCISEEQIYFFNNSKEYLAYHKKYFYNSTNEIEKEELYGRFNSKMYLCYYYETFRKDQIVTTKRFAISYYEQFAGYYDLESLNKISKTEFEFNKSQYNNKSGIEDFEQFVDYKDDYFENLKFDNNHANICKYDHKQNIIEYEGFNPEDEKDVYEKSIYHNE